MRKAISTWNVLVGTLIALLILLNLYQFFMTPAPGPGDSHSARSVIFPGWPSEVDPKELDDIYHPSLDPAQKLSVKNFHQVLYPITPTTNWLGVVTLQNPFDMWMHQEIITEVKPDFVVECGTYKGGSALIWSMLLDVVNPSGRVISIDIENHTADAAKLTPWKRVELLQGSSTDPHIVSEVTKRVMGKNVVVILDSDHTRDHVLAELRAYAPLVPLNSYLIVQDTDINKIVRLDHGPGPMDALDIFLKENDQFKSDRNRERLLFTNHPKGYLKRIK